MGGPASNGIQNQGGTVQAELASPQIQFESSLRENFATDSSFDFGIHGESAKLHGGHLHPPSSRRGDVSIHKTADGDTWLQIARHQESGERLSTASYSAYRNLLSCANEI